MFWLVPPAGRNTTPVSLRDFWHPFYIGRVHKCCEKMEYLLIFMYRTLKRKRPLIYTFCMDKANVTNTVLCIFLTMKKFKYCWTRTMPAMFQVYTLTCFYTHVSKASDLQRLKSGTYWPDLIGWRTLIHTEDHNQEQMSEVEGKPLTSYSDICPVLGFLNHLGGLGTE